MEHHRPVHVCLTGGPCAGKTSALTHLYDHLTARGWRVIIVPEAATIVLGASGRLEVERTAAYFVAAQEAILTLQRDLPTILGGVLNGGEEKVVFLHDRAELDNRAYLEERLFTELIERTHGLTPWAVGERYDAVIHLITAAEGAEEAYSLSNNEARTESPEQARALDEACRRAWLGHPHYTVIPNEGDFDGKLTRTLQAVLNVLGEPEPVEVERKWLLSEEPDVGSLSATPVHIEQHYLTPPPGGEEEVRVRKRTVGEHTTHYRTTKSAGPDAATRIEREELISAETYHQLLAYRDDATEPIVKTRWCFVHGGQHFELDHLISPVDLWMLEAELVEPHQAVTPPESLGSLREVTEDPAYRNSALARHKN